MLFLCFINKSKSRDKKNHNKMEYYGMRNWGVRDDNQRGQQNRDRPTDNINMGIAEIKIIILPIYNKFLCFFHFCLLYLNQ